MPKKKKNILTPHQKQTNLLLYLAVRVRDELLEAPHGPGLQDSLGVVGVVLRAHHVSDRPEGRLHHLGAGMVQQLHQALADPGLDNDLKEGGWARRTKDVTCVKHCTPVEDMKPPCIHFQKGKTNGTLNTPT